MIDTSFCLTLLDRVRTPSLPLSFLSMLSQHATPRPSWHVLILIRKLVHVLQVKDLYFSHGKEVVRQEARTCNLWDLPIQSRACYLEAIEAVTSVTFLSFSDVRITYSYLVKRDCRCWDRSRDLESHGPARSHGAVEAI